MACGGTLEEGVLEGRGGEVTPVGGLPLALGRSGDFDLASLPEPVFLLLLCMVEAPLNKGVSCGFASVRIVAY